jgi:hypothetical protein
MTPEDLYPTVIQAFASAKFEGEVALEKHTALA